MRRLLLVMSCALCVVSALAQTIRFTPQWVPQAQFAGYYVADSLGFYAEEGLDVQIIHPSPSHSCQDMLHDGETDIITSQLVDAMINWDRGEQLVNVLQCSENNSVMIVARQPVSTPQDLAGKKIGHWKVGFSHLAFVLDRQQGLQIDWIPFHSNIALYISGAIDATLAMEYNEYFQLLMSGTPLSDKQVLYLRDYGLNIQEDGVYVTPAYLATHKAEIAKFVAATKKGWEWARAHQEETVGIVMDVIAQNGSYSNRINQAYMLQTILRLQEDESGQAPYRLTEERFMRAVDVLQGHGYIQQPIPYQSFVYTF